MTLKTISVTELRQKLRSLKNGLWSFCKSMRDFVQGFASIGEKWTKRKSGNTLTVNSLLDSMTEGERRSLLQMTSGIEEEIQQFTGISPSNYGVLGSRTATEVAMQQAAAQANYHNLEHNLAMWANTTNTWNTAFQQSNSSWTYPIYRDELRRRDEYRGSGFGNLFMPTSEPPQMTIEKPRLMSAKEVQEEMDSRLASLKGV